jgi:hypothetical protein
MHFLVQGSAPFPIKETKQVRSSGQAGFQSSGEKLSGVHPWNSFEPFNIVMPYVGFPNSKSSP